jgi:crossover junction endodeoxyribonuclease RuvC
MDTVYVGIDPGRSGAIAVLYPDGAADAWDMPGDEREIADCLRDISILAALADQKVMAALEKVGAMPGQGVTSMFTFGQSVGVIKGCLAALRIPMLLVTPQRWQKIVFDSAAKPTDRKAASLYLARRMFPTVKLNLKKDHGKADALLIATWLKRTDGNMR